jgi:hypothetical protein
MPPGPLFRENRRPRPREEKGAAAGNHPFGHCLFSLGGMGGVRGELREFRIDGRAWNGHRNLELGAAPAVYLVWHDRALDHLSSGRPEVRKLLLWAEQRSQEELEVQLQGEAELLGVQDVERVDELLFAGGASASGASSHGFTSHKAHYDPCLLS